MNKDKQIRRKLRKPFEFTAAFIASRIIPLLSRKTILHLAQWLGDLGYRLSRRDRTIALANLDTVYGPSISESEKERIAQKAFRTFALTMLDLFWFSRNTEKRIHKYTDLSRSLKRLKKHQPAICLSAHLGNWELLGRTAAIHGHPLTSVAAPLSNTAADRLFQRLRTDTGQHIVPRRGALRKLIQASREGRHVALLIDQNTRLSEGGIFVDFFHLPTPVSPAVASLALKTGRNIIFTCCIADETGRYHDAGIRVFRTADFAVRGSKHEQIQSLTEALIRHMEQVILEEPGAWLWMYKRWQFRAPWRERQDYPYYVGDISPADRKALDRT